MSFPVQHHEDMSRLPRHRLEACDIMKGLYAAQASKITRSKLYVFPTVTILPLGRVYEATCDPLIVHVEVSRDGSVARTDGVD
jgi:hypothetical protein